MPTNDQTSATTPRHIWKDAVAVASIARGVDADWMRTEPIAKRINDAYTAEEPVWMVVDELVFRCKRSALERRADGEVSAMRRRLAGQRPV